MGFKFKSPAWTPSFACDTFKIPSTSQDKTCSTIQAPWHAFFSCCSWSVTSNHLHGSLHLHVVPSNSRKKHAQHFSLNHIMSSVTVAGLQLQSPCMNPFIFRIPFKTSFISSCLAVIVLPTNLPTLQPPCPTGWYLSKAKLHGFLSFFKGMFKGFLFFFTSFYGIPILFLRFLRVSYP